jgi:DNA modification methylase
MEPYYSDEWVTIYHGDCREILPHLSVFDLVLTDPPYGIPEGSAVVRKSTRVVEDWGSAEHNVDVDGWHRLLRPTDDAYLAEFGGAAIDTEDRIRKRHVAAGWTPWRRFLLVKAAPPPTPRKTFVSGFESCLISYRGTRRWWGGGATVDRWIGLTPNRAGTDHGHPTEKPIEPVRALIQALSREGGYVLDPFMGSGTTLRAAKDVGRKAVGIDVNEEYCEIAARRMGQEVLAL